LACEVLLVTLFEFVASQFFRDVRANNATGGTCVVEAASR